MIEMNPLIPTVEAELAKRADQYPLLTGKFAGLRKYRIGKYRVIYTLQHDMFLILRIGHRIERILKRERKVNPS